MKRTLTISLLIITLLPLLAQNDDYVEIGVVEKLDQYIHMDAMLVDINGDTVIIDRKSVV